MRNFYSFTREENKRLADAFTAMADIFELVRVRAELSESTQSAETQVRVLDPRPMPPPSMLKMYYADHVEAVTASNPDIAQCEVTSLIAEQWMNASMEVCSLYRNRYTALARQYKIDIAAYDARANANVPPESGQSVPTARLAEPEHAASSVSPDPLPQPTKLPNMDRTLEREMGPKPVVPVPPNRLYFKGIIESVRQENPGIEFGDARKIVSARWKNASVEERQPYIDLHRELKRQYLIDISVYDACKEAFVSTYSWPVPTKQLTKDEVLERELGPKPVTPMAASRLYYKDVIGDIYRDNPGISWQAARRLASDRWKALSEEDQRPFKDRHHALNKQFMIDIAAYNAREKTFLLTYDESVSTKCLAGTELEPETTYSDEEIEIERELGPRPTLAKDVLDLFCLDHTRDVLSDNPGLSVEGARKILAPRWKRFDKEMRQPYLDRFKHLKEQYEVDIGAYYDRVRALILAAYGEPDMPNTSSDVLEWKLGRKPAQPLHASQLYHRDHRMDVVKDNPGISCAEAKKITGEQWAAANTEVRKTYTSRRRELQKVYTDNIASYSAREHALIRAAIRKVRESRGYRASNALNAAQPSQHPIPSTWPCHPPQPTERLHGPARTTISVPSGFTGLPPLLPAPIGSLGSPCPVGLPVSSQPILSLAPPGSFDVAEPAHSLASLGPAEVTVTNESPASTSLPANSGNLPRQTVSVKDSISSIRAIVSGLVAMADTNATTTLAEPIVSPEPIPLGMQPMPVGIQDTAEITSIVKSPEPSLCTDPHAPAETTPVLIMPVIPVVSAEPAESLTLTKKKSKKKRNHAADDDVQEPGADQSTSPHRKKVKRAKGDLKDSKKKKHKPKVVVKLEENTDAMTTNMDNRHTDSADPIVNAAIKAKALLNFTFGSNHFTLNQ